jgi:hypothetical protein
LGCGGVSDAGGVGAISPALLVALRIGRLHSTGKTRVVCLSPALPLAVVIWFMNLILKVAAARLNQIITCDIGGLRLNTKTKFKDEVLIHPHGAKHMLILAINHVSSRMTISIIHFSSWKYHK